VGGGIVCVAGWESRKERRRFGAEVGDRRGGLDVALNWGDSLGRGTVELL